VVVRVERSLSFVLAGLPELLLLFHCSWVRVLLVFTPVEVLLLLLRSFTLPSLFLMAALPLLIPLSDLEVEFRLLFEFMLERLLLLKSPSSRRLLTVLFRLLNERSGLLL
jgi:hypothetical protein